MKIERVTTELARLQPPRPLASAGARVSSLDDVVVQLGTADGLEGVGYACIYAGPEAGALRVLIDDLAGSALVAAALDTTVASGENCYTASGVRALIEQRAADLVQLDLQRMGGLTGWLEAAALCGAHALPVSNHFFLDVTAHGLCACPREPVGEYIPWPSPFEMDARVVAGELVMGQSPGLGLTRAS